LAWVTSGYPRVSYQVMASLGSCSCLTFFRAAAMVTTSLDGATAVHASSDVWAASPGSVNSAAATANANASICRRRTSKSISPVIRQRRAPGRVQSIISGRAET
jgi:hypothetical protein